MKQIFDKIKVTCHTCGTPLDGEDIPRIGDRFYCRSDYEKASPEEKAENRKMERESELLKNILQDS